VKIVALLPSVDEVGGAGERDAQRCSVESGQAVRSSSGPQTTDTGTWPGSVTEQVVASALSARLMSPRRGWGVMTSGRAPSNRHGPYAPRTTRLAAAGVTFRRWLVITSACVLLAAIAVVVMLITSSDPNHQTADDVARHAGIPASATPGPHP